MEFDINLDEVTSDSLSYGNAPLTDGVYNVMVSEVKTVRKDGRQMFDKKNNASGVMSFESLDPDTVGRKYDKWLTLSGEANDTKMTKMVVATIMKATGKVSGKVSIFDLIGSIVKITIAKGNVKADGTYHYNLVKVEPADAQYQVALREPGADEDEAFQG